MVGKSKEYPCKGCQKQLTGGNLHCPHCGMYEPWRDPPSPEAKIAAVILLSLTGVAFCVLGTLILLKSPIVSFFNYDPGIAIAMIALGAVTLLSIIGIVVAVRRKRQLKP